MAEIEGIVSQLNWVKNELRSNGKVSRNEALQRYISRLGALICDLKKEGWRIEGRWVSGFHGRDYVYYMKSMETSEANELLKVLGEENGRNIR